MSFISYENGHELFGKVGNAISGQQGLLADTVGWTGKNLLPNSGTSVSGDLSFTVNSDGSVTINGTADSSADATFQIYRGLYLPSGKPFIVSADYYSADVCLEIWEYGWANRQTLATGEITVNYSDASHNSDRIIRIFVKKGTTVNNVTIKPMIRDAAISDSTYEPHHESVDACKFQIGKELSSSDNLNDIKDSGIYGVGASPTNSPESLSYYILIVKEYTNGLVQVAYRHNVMYSRRANIEGSTISWTRWYKFTGTEVV